MPGAFIQAKLNKDGGKEMPLMKLEGTFVDIMCEVIQSVKGISRMK